MSSMAGSFANFSSLSELTPTVWFTVRVGDGVVEYDHHGGELVGGGGVVTHLAEEPVAHVLEVLHGLVLLALQLAL
eukprot:4000139-Pyramimonas_sp.AAC.1